MLIKDTSKHLNLAIDKIKYLEKELNELKKIASQLSILEKDRIDLKIEINELKQIIKNNNYQQNNLIIKKEEKNYDIKNENVNENDIDNYT